MTSVGLMEFNIRVISFHCICTHENICIYALFSYTCKCVQSNFNTIFIECQKQQTFTIDSRVNTQYVHQEKRNEKKSKNRKLKIESLYILEYLLWLL